MQRRQAAGPGERARPAAIANATIIVAAPQYEEEPRRRVEIAGVGQRLAIPFVPLVAEPAIDFDMDEFGARGGHGGWNLLDLSTMAPPPLRTDLATRARYSQGGRHLPPHPGRRGAGQRRRQNSPPCSAAARNRGLTVTPRGAGSAMTRRQRHHGPDTRPHRSGLPALPDRSSRPPRIILARDVARRAQSRGRALTAFGCRSIRPARRGRPSAAWCRPTPPARTACARAACGAGFTASVSKRQTAPSTSPRPRSRTPTSGDGALAQ